MVYNNIIIYLLEKSFSQEEELLLHKRIIFILDSGVLAGTASLEALSVILWMLRLRTRTGGMGQENYVSYGGSYLDSFLAGFVVPDHAQMPSWSSLVHGSYNIKFSTHIFTSKTNLRALLELSNALFGHVYF